MNTIYNVVWNSTTGTWVVASEMAKGRKKKSKAASAASAAVLVTATGMSVGAMLMPGTAMAQYSGSNSWYEAGFCANSDGQVTGLSGGSSIITSGSCHASGNAGYGSHWGWGGEITSYNYALINGHGTDAKVSAMWLDGDLGTINFDVGAMHGQVIRINPNGQMDGLTDGDVFAGSTDAITGNQLFALQSKVEEIGSGGGTVKYFHANSTAADSSATGGEAIAIGPVAKGTGYNSIALGNSATAGGQSGIAIGSGAVTEADWTFAAGNAAAAKASGDTALGASALASGGGQWATALGTQAKATATKSTAVGGGAQATHHYSAAIGSESTTDRINSVSVGNASWQRQVTFVAKGTQGTDAVNVDQLKGVTTALGGGAGVDATTGAVKAPTYNVAGGSYTNVGAALAAVDIKAGSGSGSNKYFHTNTTLADSVTTGADSIAIGGNAASDGKWSLAAGTNAKATADNSVALGNSSLADRINSVSVGSATTQRQIINVAKGTADTDAVNISQLKGVTAAIGGGAGVKADGSIDPGFTIGSTKYANVAEAVAAVDAKTGNGNSKYFHANSTGADSVATGGDSIAVGLAANAKANYDVAVGANSVADGAGQSATALGNGAQATATQSTAVGAGAQATHHYSVALGQNSTTDRTNSVSVGNASWQRQVTFVAKGTQGTDAVNVDQLKGVTAAIGGGTAVNADGSINKPAITISGTKYENVADAIAAVDAKTGSGNSKYFHTNTTLADSVTTGADSIAIGGNAASDGKWSLAAGTNAKATADNSVALGNSSLADRANSVSVGSATTQRQITNLAQGTLGTDAVNVDQLNDSLSKLPGGKNAVSYDGDDHLQVTLNPGGAATRVTNVADGKVEAGSKDAVNGDQLFKVEQKVGEIGPKLKYIKFGMTGAADAQANSQDSTAIGGNAFANATGALALGNGARAIGINTVAAGKSAQASGDNSVALGVDAAAQGANSVALGAGSTTGFADAWVVSVGNALNKRRITNVADGVAASDAATVGQVNTAISKAFAVKSSRMASPLLVTTPSVVSSVPVDQLIAAGPTTLGGQIQAEGQNALAIGLNTHATADNAVAAGQNISAAKANAVGVGETVTINGERGVAIGSKVSVDAAEAAVFGTDSSANAANSVAIGSHATTKSTAAESVAIGNGAQAWAAKTVALGQGSTDDNRANTVSVGSTIIGTDVKRQVINVAKGTLDYDAVNVSQLKDALTKVVGGTTPATIDKDGNVTAPTFVVAGKDTHSVGEALGAVEALARSGSLLAVEYDDDTKTKVTLNKGGTTGPVTITNVKNGIASADAVNMGQLKPAIDGLGGGATVDPTTGVVTGPTYNITKIDGTTTTVHNVGDAITNIDGRTTQNTTNITNVLSGKAGLVQQAAAGEDLTVGKDTDGVGVNFAGTAGVRLLRGVSAGKADTDAVNVSQLKGALTTVVGGTTPATIDKDGNVTAPTFVVDGKDTHSVGEALGAVEALAKTGSSLGVAYDDTTKTKVTLNKGGTTGPVTITNVKNGIASADAINMGQLKPVIDGLGGGATVDPTTGVVTGPTYNITKIDGTTTTVHTVGDAITNIDGRTTQNTTDITNVLSGKAGLVQQAAAGANLTVGKNTDGVAVDFTANGGMTRQLKGVAAGLVSASSTDAINGSQLYATGKSVAEAIGGGSTVGTDGKVSKPSITVAGQTYDNLAGAISAVDAKVGTGDPLGVAYDDTTKTKVTLNKGGTTGPVTIANVKNGIAPADAINLGQLKPVIDGLGGGATVDPTTGVVTGPTYNITKIDGTTTTVHTVGDAITNLDGRTTQNTTNITNVLSGKAGLVQQAAAGQKLTVGKDTDGTEVNFTGTSGDRKLSGVAKGTADNDAVNVKQLKDAGLVDGNGNVANAVTYDSAAKDSVTLGNAGKAVTLKNVANATKDDEAINLGQLRSTGLVGENGKVLDAVVYDAGSNKASVTFGGMNGTVLNNVSDGRIEAGSRQAINGGQIAAIKSALEGRITNIDNRVTTIEQHGGGGGNPAYVTANGIGGSPKPANAGDSAGVAVGYDTNASGLGASAIGDHATAAGIDSVAIGNNASTNATGANSVALGNGSVADRANTVSVGSEGHERTISNVARGSRETDAVNVGLLDERVRDLGTSANAYTDKMVNDVWSNLKEEIDHSNRQANRGIAAASALINVTPYIPGHVTVNAGVAGYRGESALGVGVSRWSENGRINLNAGVSAAQGDEPVYRVGIGYIF